jgi:hypothetical protein
MESKTGHSIDILRRLAFQGITDQEIVRLVREREKYNTVPRQE